MNTPTRLVLVGLSLALGACAGMFRSQSAAPEVYALRAGPAVVTPHAVEATLVVARPVARPGLDGDRIAVTLPDRRLDAYAGGRWSAPLPRLVEGLLVDGLRGAAAFRAVVTERSAFGGRYLLQVEITEFAADYAAVGATPVARVTLRGELGIGTERRLIASVTGSAAMPAKADRQRDVAAAFESAYAAAAAQLIEAVDEAAFAEASAPHR